MERRIEVEVSLNGLDVDNNPIFCQGDKNTHAIQIKFLEEIELEGYELQVYYLLIKKTQPLPFHFFLKLCLE